MEPPCSLLENNEMCRGLPDLPPLESHLELRWISAVFAARFATFCVHYWREIFSWEGVSP
jgi:hypothetical protein